MVERKTSTTAWQMYFHVISLPSLRIPPTTHRCYSLLPTLSISNESLPTCPKCHSAAAAYLLDISIPGPPHFLYGQRLEERAATRRHLALFSLPPLRLRYLIPRRLVHPSDCSLPSGFPLHAFHCLTIFSFCHMCNLIYNAI